MKRTILNLVLAIALLLAGGTLVAHADDTEPAAEGTLTAQGDGVAGIRCRGTVEIEVKGSGVIWVAEGDVAAEGQGERFDLPRGGTLLVGWRGKVTVSGERAGLRLISHSVDIKATGAGVATLHGSGTYEADGKPGAWSLTGTNVRFGLPVVVRGQGTLTASGSGEALIRGRGRVEIRSHGEGVIRIRGDARVTVDGEEPAQPQAQGLGQRLRRRPRQVVLRDVEGLVVAEGSAFEVGMRSAQIEFTATGQGVALLRGEGSYQVGGEEGAWSESGARVRIAPEEG